MMLARTAFGLLFVGVASACASSPSSANDLGASAGATGGDAAAGKGGMPGGGSVSGGAGGSPGAGGVGNASGSPSMAGAGNGGAAAGGAGNGGAAAGGAGNGGAAAGGGTPIADVLDADFEGATPGPYTEAMVEGDFGFAPSWNDGLDEGRATIATEGDNQFLRVTYPSGQFGPANGGVQFKLPFGQSYEELFFAYKVRFASGFSFVKGGKLPGLVGGSSPTGCGPKPDGFSARNMWRTGGAIVQYVYWPNQPKTCGDDLAYELASAPRPFSPGTWQTVEHRIKMSTPGAADGVLEAWVDGALVLSDTARFWRAAGATYAIDTLYFSTFFGGGDATWAPASAQTSDFDDFLVSRKPLTH